MPQSVTTRPRLSREEARERILEATGELVRDRSFAELTVGEITIDHPWARATAAQQANGAAYLVVDNGGEADPKRRGGERVHRQSGV